MNIQENAVYCIGCGKPVVYNPNAFESGHVPFGLTPMFKESVGSLVCYGCVLKISSGEAKNGGVSGGVFHTNTMCDCGSNHRKP